MATSGYVTVSKSHMIGAANKRRKKLPPMKLSLKQRLRNWLLNDQDEYANLSIDEARSPDLQSNSFRLNVYGASGGIIIETTRYDRKSDENRHSLHVVTEEQDLGEQIAKIITMEQLKS
jgi:hypothetical protein